MRAVQNDGSRSQAEAIAAWVTSTGCGASAYIEQIAPGNWGVVVLRPGQAQALWVLTDQHLLLDPRREPQLDVFNDEEFHACYEVRARQNGRVRECPIFEDRESAS